MHGGTVCRMHGGAAPQVRAAAARRVAEGRVLHALARLGVEVVDDVTPTAALHEALSVALGDFRAARRAVGEVPLDGLDSLPAVVTVYERAADRLAKVARSSLDAGLSERLVAVAEDEAAGMRDAFDRACIVVGIAAATRSELALVLATELRRPLLQLEGA